MNKHRVRLLKQKLMGVALIIATLVVIPIMDGDATFALLTIPLGALSICSKERLDT